MAGLFDTFTIAKRGLFASQGMINTTAHNISNADTEGYSRQRANATTTKPFGGMSRFDTCSVGQVGTGVEISSIQRIRDYFIDYQVRSETGTSAYYTQQNETLSKVESVFGEPSDNGIQELTNEFFNAFQELSKTPDKTDVQAVALKKASSLADRLNYVYNQLEKTCEDTQDKLKSNVSDVNSYLDQINQLNKQIRSVSAVGQAPNDLMDKRDNLLDKLSQKFGIEVKRDSFETINLTSTEYTGSPLVKSDPNDTGYSRLSYIENATANNDGATPPVYDGTVTIKYHPLGDVKTTKTFTVTVDGTSAADKENNAKALAYELKQNQILIGDKDGYVGTLSTTSTITVPSDVEGVVTDPVTGVITKTEISDGKTVKTTITPPSTTLGMKKTEFQTYKYDTYLGTAVNDVDDNHIKGEIAANQSVQETIKRYMDSLDKLAAGLGYSVNAIQTGSINGGDSKTTPVTDSSSSQGLADSPLFVTYNDTTKENNDTDEGLTAKNIRVNAKCTLNCNTTSASGTGDGKRAAAIAKLNVMKMNISNIPDGQDLTKLSRSEFLSDIGINTTTTTSGFSDSSCLSLNAGTDGSTADSYYKTIINNLAVITQEASRQQDNQESILSDLEDQRNSVSGVSLDEETTNLIQYQHAYQANAKMISTIDELLDVVINGLKR